MLSTGRSIGSGDRQLHQAPPDDRGPLGPAVLRRRRRPDPTSPARHACSVNNIALQSLIAAFADESSTRLAITETHAAERRRKRHRDHEGPGGLAAAGVVSHHSVDNQHAAFMHIFSVAQHPRDGAMATAVEYPEEVDQNMGVGAWPYWHDGVLYNTSAGVCINSDSYALVALPTTAS
ncbi:hypothetical protein GCM10022403_019380 [Streptomyces coacervatus]|uniref:Uncharacterized protein n=1 Tax=Streptomyces coacervatus TaxID=647381 RepID=A0ABP7H504_9ACTN|nr:hypothetical protein [Streptomyces coacervatus]MDF2267417.1 hypothetical protein [Streptomyces coacervatus]